MSGKTSISGSGIMGAAMARGAARDNLNGTGWDRPPGRASDLSAIYLALNNGAKR
ncbi:MAG: hypothetical protein H0X25_24405 [Acidobacteriales bacterium]|nr:hypothetical protein [Terriglobales bacterium]